MFNLFSSKTPETTHKTAKNSMQKADEITEEILKLEKVIVEVTKLGLSATDHYLELEELKTKQLSI